jgi:hypothetical protein
MYQGRTDGLRWYHIGPDYGFRISVSMKTPAVAPNKTPERVLIQQPV